MGFQGGERETKTKDEGKNEKKKQRYEKRKEWGKKKKGEDHSGESPYGYAASGK